TTRRNHQGDELMTGQLVTYRCPHCHQLVDVDLHSDTDVVICPNENCKKPFKLEIPTAEPAAGLIVPPGAEPAATPPTPAASAAQAVAPMAIRVASATQAPPAAIPVEEPEVILGTVHLSMFRRYPFRCLGYAALMAMSLTGVIYCLVWDHSYL